MDDTIEHRTIQLFDDRLKSKVFQAVGSAANAQDVVQEIYIKILKNADKINSASSSESYLRTLIRHAIVDYHRGQRMTLSLDDLDPPSPLTSHMTYQDLAEYCISAFIGLLPDKYKTAVYLADIQQIPQTELAEQLGLSYSALKSRVQRGRVMLKDMLLDCCEMETDDYGHVVHMSQRR